MWRMRFEDALSVLHFRSMNSEHQKMQEQLAELQEKYQQACVKVEELDQLNHSSRKRELLAKAEIRVLEDKLRQVEAILEDLRAGSEELQVQRDQSAMKLGDAEAFAARFEAKWQEQRHIADGLLATLRLLEEDKRELQERIAALEACTGPGPTSSYGAAQCRLGASLYNTREMKVQTDLSYQYLEAKPPETVVRSARVRKLKDASQFVEDKEAARDFDVPIMGALGQTSTPAPRATPTQRVLYMRAATADADTRPGRSTATPSGIGTRGGSITPQDRGYTRSATPAVGARGGPLGRGGPLDRVASSTPMVGTRHGPIVESAPVPRAEPGRRPESSQY